MHALGNGVYSLGEAARLTRLRPARVRGWFRALDAEPSKGAVFRSDYPPVGDDRAISFLDLIEVYIAGRLREATPSVSLQHIRAVHRKMSADLGVKHPFCSREIYHGGGKIFARPLDDGTTGSVIEPLTNQLYINDVIMPFLGKIEYDDASKMAKIWHISEGVVVDPERSYGKPIVGSVGISTRVLAGAYEANGRDVARVAEWYEIDPADVKAAVDFENQIAA